jgi:hypothetical protein
MTVHPQRGLFRRIGVAAACASTLAHCVSEPGELFSDVDMNASAPAPGTGVPGAVGPAQTTGIDTPTPTSEASSPTTPLVPGAAPAPAGGGNGAGEPGAAGEPVAPTAAVPENAEPPAPVVDPDPTGGARVCPQPAQPLLLDFEVPGNSATEAQFGDFASVFSGGTFVYPVNPAAIATEPFTAFGLSSDVSAGQWRVQGAVAEPAGFGLFFTCELLDASRFTGIAFRMQGSVGLGQEVTFFVNGASNEVSRTWLVQEGRGSNVRSFGRCFPAQSQFDGSCLAPRIVLPVSAEPTEVFVPFAALANGSPEATLNPAEITAVQWALPVPVPGDAGVNEPYAVDLIIDDIRFVEAE